MNASIQKLLRNLYCGERATFSRTPTVLSVIAGRIGFSLMWFVGRRLEFHFIESAITAGLCMTNTGGAGAVAVLSAAKRMPLMPFARLFTSIGGTLIIFLCGLLAPYSR